MYIGEVDEDEYISWQPVEKDFYDFDSLEEDLGVRIHPSIIEYFIHIILPI
ncbi:hypothetical protein [Paenibacillus sp. SYP-B3998]|uniref:hypothetical protein n=1 Tax=Paenibacillus sp. SYP-B3998 TaxID=2678564 RepID=UPI0031F7A6F6